MICPYCKKETPSRSRRCPECGLKQPKRRWRPSRRTVFIVVLAWVAVALLSGIINSMVGNPAQPDSSSSNLEESAATQQTVQSEEETMPSSSAESAPSSQAPAEESSGATSQPPVSSQAAGTDKQEAPQQEPPQPVQSQPEQSQPPQPEQSQMVWIVQNGKTYHLSPDCSNMKSPYQVSLTDAVNSGRRPCKKCF